MDINQRTAIKSKYIELIQGFGYKILMDLDKNLSDELYDIHLFCSRTDKTDDNPTTRKRYVALAIPYTSALSFNEFTQYEKGQQKENFRGQFIEGLRNRMVEYTMDDIAAVLLHSGYHLQDFYVFVQGKGRLNFNTNTIIDICDYLGSKGSPLK